MKKLGKNKEGRSPKVIFWLEYRSDPSSSEGCDTHLSASRTDTIQLAI